MKKVARFLVDVKKELKKVRWPSKKEMITYSVATVSLVVIFALFFTLTDLLVAGIKTVIK